MASSYNADLLAEYSLNLLRGQMFSQLTGMSLNGWSLADFVLGRPPKRSGTDIMNDAVSGLMRSDAALLRQGSKNMAQGKALLESGAAALESIAGKAAHEGNSGQRGPQPGRDSDPGRPEGGISLPGLCR